MDILDLFAIMFGRERYKIKINMCSYIKKIYSLQKISISVNIYNVCKKCVLCNSEKSIHHFFIACPFALLYGELFISLLMFLLQPIS